MMHVLLESAPRRGPRGPGWTAASFATHATIIAAAVLLTARTISAPPEPPSFYPDMVFPVQTPPPAQPVAPASPMPSVLHRPIYELPLLPSVPLPDPTTTTVPNRTDFPMTPIARPAGGLVSEAGANGIHEPHQVEQVVRPRSGNPSPEYPRALRSAGVEGDVLVRFIVDTLGRVESNSVEIRESTHARFADAVREWLRRTRYDPATIADRPVRQLVEQRVGFTLRR